MIPLVMMVSHELRDASSKVPLAERNHPIETSSLIDRTKRSAYARALD